MRTKIMYHHPRNASVRPHQVNHCVKTFDALLRNNLHRFFNVVNLLLAFRSNLVKCLMLFINLHFSSII